MAKRKSDLVVLQSTAGTGYRYVKRRNKTNTPEPLLLKKYDPKARKHVDFKEIKGGFK